MDSSYNSGGQFVPGVKPGTIASGPDASDVPNIPSMPSSGADDAGKRKRSLFVAGIVMGVLAVALLVVGVVLMNKGNGNNNNNTAIVTDYGLFASYADYLLNTSDDTGVEVTEYDFDKDYAVQLAFYDNDTAYFDQLGALWNKFYAKIVEENKYSVVSKIMGDINYQNELMDFMMKYMANRVWNESDLLELYLEDGLKNATDEVTENYTNMASTIYEPGKAYAEGMLKNTKIVLGEYSEYDSLGCVVNKKVDFDCVDRNASSITFVNEDDWGYVDEDLPEDTIETLIEFGIRINNDFRSLGE